MASCNDCDADVRWCLLPNGDKVMLDAAPVTGALPGGRRYVILPNGDARIATNDDIRLHRQIYTRHWDTCRKRSHR